MLTHTFCHLPGVGPRTEARLWNAGALSWECLLGDHPYPRALLPEVSRQILGRLAEGLQLASIQVTIGPDGSFVYA